MGTEGGRPAYGRCPDRVPHDARPRGVHHPSGNHLQRPPLLPHNRPRPLRVLRTPRNRLRQPWSPAAAGEDCPHTSPHTSNHRAGPRPIVHPARIHSRTRPIQTAGIAAAGTGTAAEEGECSLGTPQPPQRQPPRLPWDFPKTRRSTRVAHPPERDAPWHPVPAVAPPPLDGGSGAAGPPHRLLKSTYPRDRPRSSAPVPRVPSGRAQDQATPAHFPGSPYPIRAPRLLPQEQSACPAPTDPFPAVAMDPNHAVAPVPDRCLPLPLLPRRPVWGKPPPSPPRQLRVQGCPRRPVHGPPARRGDHPPTNSPQLAHRTGRPNRSSGRSPPAQHRGGALPTPALPSRPSRVAEVVGCHRGTGCPASSPNPQRAAAFPQPTTYCHKSHRREGGSSVASSARPWLPPRGDPTPTVELGVPHQDPAGGPAKAGHFDCAPALPLRAPNSAAVHPPLFPPPRAHDHRAGTPTRPSVHRPLRPSHPGARARTSPPSVPLPLVASVPPPPRSAPPSLPPA